MEFFSKGPKNEFETAVVNEPSVFEPLKFYCISKFDYFFQCTSFFTYVRNKVGLISLACEDYDL